MYKFQQDLNDQKMIAFPRLFLQNYIYCSHKIKYY